MSMSMDAAMISTSCQKVPVNSVLLLGSEKKKGDRTKLHNSKMPHKYKRGE